MNHTNSYIYKEGGERGEKRKREFRRFSPSNYVPHKIIIALQLGLEIALFSVGSF